MPCFAFQRNIVIHEHKGKCAKCGKRYKEVHHIDVDKTNNELSNLIPLCRKCHIATHVKLGTYKDGHAYMEKVLTSFVNVYLFGNEFEEIRNNNRTGGTWDRVRGIIANGSNLSSVDYPKVGIKRLYRVGVTANVLEIIDHISTVQGITSGEYVRRKALER